MIVVLDASAALEVVLSRPNASIFKELLLRSERRISSALYQIEVANVLWKYVRLNHLTLESAILHLQLANQLVDDFVQIEEYCEEALLESIRLSHSAYDMLYLTLARRKGATLLTLDKKLIEIARSQAVLVETGPF